ncbi:MAG: hypothetical protein HY051_04980 [Candidatus Aenigmarchaeota archaeon]|nr:hypothetical protein [Candidatus Aenigmarchaeota archaeon]
MIFHDKPQDSNLKFDVLTYSHELIHGVLLFFENPMIFKARKPEGFLCPVFPPSFLTIGGCFQPCLPRIYRREYNAEARLSSGDIMTERIFKLGGI